MAEPLITVDRETYRELRRFVRAAAQVEPKMRRRLPQLHRTLARDVATKARGRARGMGGVHRLASGSITGRGTNAGAAVSVGRHPAASAAFWGAKKRTGWNARNPDSRPQHPSWIGNSWEVGGQGGPYAINPTIRAEEKAIVERFDDLLGALARDVGFT